MKDVKRSILFTLWLADGPIGYQVLYSVTGFAPSSIRVAISELVSQHMVSTYEQQGGTMISISALGKDQVIILFPGLRASSRKWTGTWTLLLHHGERTPKVSRQIKDVLGAVGCAPMMNGVFIACGSQGELVGSLLGRVKLAHHVLVLETKREGGIDEEQILRSYFRLDEYRRDSERLERKIADVERYFVKNRTGKTGARRVQEILTQARSLYRSARVAPEKYFPQELQPLVLTRRISAFLKFI